MAIPFLNNLNINDNQLLNAKVQVGSTAPTAAKGQIYLDSTTNVNTLKYHDGSQWIGLKQLNLNNSTFINLSNLSATGSNIISLEASLNATGTPDNTKFLRGDNTWSSISQYTGWTLAGSTGTSQSIGSGDTATFAGGTYITTAAGATDTLTITHNSTTRSDTASAASPALGATFTAVDSVTTNATGHVTALNLKTVTLPTTAVTQATGDNSTLIATTAFVQAAVTGLLEFKGGFNASTGAITSGSNSGLFLWGATRVAIAIGDYYVATVSGNFYGDALYPLTPGDSVIATVDRAANASLVTDWSVIQSDTDLATLTTVGIGNVNAGAGISVSYSNGTATVSANTTSSTGQITAGSLTGTVTHTFGINTMVQTYDVSNGDTVFCDVTRTSTSVTATIAQTNASNIIILVQKIG